MNHLYPIKINGIEYKAWGTTQETILFIVSDNDLVDHQIPLIQVKEVIHENVTRESNITREILLVKTKIFTFRHKRLVFPVLNEFPIEGWVNLNRWIEFTKKKDKK